MPFLKIPYRDYPKKGLFKKLYRENIYKIEEFKDEFKYYEYTPIDKYADLMAESGMAGVFVCGTTGESHSLTLDGHCNTMSRSRAS